MGQALDQQARSRDPVNQAGKGSVRELGQSHGQYLVPRGLAGQSWHELPHVGRNRLRAVGQCSHG